MILGFKDQFVPMVLDGSKTHTIRAGFRWKAGMRADLYTGAYRPGARRLLFRAVVTKVEPIAIASYEAVQDGRGPWNPLAGDHCLGAQRGPCGECLLVKVNGKLLSADESVLLCWLDGFRDCGAWSDYQALTFWGDDLPLAGQLIHWDYERRFEKVEDTCYRVSEWTAQEARKKR